MIRFIKKYENSLPDTSEKFTFKQTTFNLFGHFWAQQSGSTNKQDDYTRCRGEAKIRKIRVTSLADTLRLVYKIHIVKMELLANFQAQYISTS